MSKSPVFVIVGGGLAGAKAVESLRSDGFAGRIVVIGDEGHHPYDRQALSKDFLAAKTTPLAHAYCEADRRLGLADLTVHGAGWYRDHRVELRLGTPVVALDPAAHHVALADATTVGYDKLLLATGSRARRPALPGIYAAGVHSLRDVDDAAALDDALVAGSSLAVIGAGWIGLEVAASARQRGVGVTVIGRSELPVATLGAEVAAIFAELHRANGVELVMPAHPAAIATEAGRACGVVLADGTQIPAETVLVAAGAEPNIELAENAGLATGDGGVLVNAALRTSDPDIYAAGDIAAADNPFLGTRIRLGHWATARKQPAVATAAMRGAEAAYDELPYFFTDQYDFGMEYVGHAVGYRRVVFRGDVAAGEFIGFWLDAQRRVLAGMSVNVWPVVDDLKALIRSRARVDVDRLADPRQPLAGLLHGS